MPLIVLLYTGIIRLGYFYRIKIDAIQLTLRLLKIIKYAAQLKSKSFPSPDLAIMKLLTLQIKK